MKIILIRHGETIWNKERRLQGCKDIPLSYEGKEQIRHTGTHLARTFSQIDLILTSPLQRAKESAEIIAKEVGYPLKAIVEAPLFTERSFGAGEGLTYEEALAQYPDNDYPGMESLDDLCLRADHAIRQCVEDHFGKTILVIAHGAIIKAALVTLTAGRIQYFDENVWIGNGSYCLLEYRDALWHITIHNYNDYAALPLQ